MLEKIIVLALVAGAGIYLFRRMTRKGGSCCGCSGSSSGGCCGGGGLHEIKPGGCGCERKS